MRFWFILILSVILLFAYIGMPGEYLFSKEMIGLYLGIGVIAFLMKFDYWWKDIIKEIKEIANEE